MTELRCADVEARFVDAFDGRLDPAESVRFHAHIEGCAACRERAALWRALVPAAARRRAARARGDGDPAHAGRDRAPAARRADRRVPRRGAGGPGGRRRSGWSAAAAAVVIWLRVGRPAPAPLGRLRRGRERARRGTRRAIRRRGRPRAFRSARRSRSRPAPPSSWRWTAAPTLQRRRPGAPGAGGQRARDVAVRLDRGASCSAEVAHRQAGRDLRGHHERPARRGPRHEVLGHRGRRRLARRRQRRAGRGSASRTADSLLVSAGGSVRLGRPARAAARAAAPPSRADARRRAVVRRARARSCQTTARGGPRQHARRRARARAPADRGRAARAARRRRDLRGERGACEDELRYLHAEALNQAGRLDDAVAAYRALDRRGAPAGDAAERALRGGAD